MAKLSITMDDWVIKKIVFPNAKGNRSEFIQELVVEAWHNRELEQARNGAVREKLKNQAAAPQGESRVKHFWLEQPKHSGEIT